MAPKSWAQIASYPKKPASSSSTTDWPEINPQQKPLQSVAVTGQELEQGVKFSWSDNPKHLHNSPQASDNESSSNMESTKKTLATEPAEESGLKLTPIFTVASLTDETKPNVHTSLNICEAADDETANASECVASDQTIIKNTEHGGIDSGSICKRMDPNNCSSHSEEALGLDIPPHDNELESSPSPINDTIHKAQDSAAASSSPYTEHITTGNVSDNNEPTHPKKPDFSAAVSDTDTDDRTNAITSIAVNIESQLSVKDATTQDASVPTKDEPQLNMDEDQKTKDKGKGKAQDMIPSEDSNLVNSINDTSSTQLGGTISTTAAQGDSTLQFQQENMASYSSSSIAGPSSVQVAQTRVGNITFSAAPDSDQDKSHPSGLSYQQRFDLVRERVENALALRRATALREEEEDTTDIALIFDEPDGGVTELYYHREILAKESGWLRNRMPPPKEDGSRVGLYMGNWPAPIVRQVFEFMYTHKIEVCEPPAEDDFYNMSSVAGNCHQYILACAFDCPRQRQYHLDNLTKVVEVAARQTRGNYRDYQLAYWEFAMCEQKLRMANRVAFQERLYPEMQRPFRALLSRINAVMVPWLLRGKYMGVIMTPLWYEMKEEYIPWREALWHNKATGQVQSDDWTWLGPQMTEQQISVALGRFGGGF